MKSLSNGIVVCCLLAASIAAASEESERLYSRGLVEFHADHFTEALKFFDQAVAADATDVYAHYYRAVTRGRLNDLDGAISDLHVALVAKPDFTQAALELGLAFVQAGKYREGVPWLQQAQRDYEAYGQACLFLGIAYVRLGDLANARANFTGALHDPAQRLAAEYYLGVVDYQENDFPSAEPHFRAVIASSPDTEMGHEASQFLERIQQGVRAAYQAYGALGFEYDSNVLLAPSNEVIKEAADITRQADGRITMSLGGTYAVWRHPVAQLSVGYDFYQSLHFDLHDFDLQDHGPNVQLICKAGPVQIGILGRFDYYLLSSENFLQEATALPWLVIPEKPYGRTELSYRMRRRDFLNPDFRIRDAFNHSPAVRQFFYLQSPSQYVFVGYRFDREDPVVGRPEEKREANSFAYDGHEASGGIGWTFPAAISGELSYTYRYERYAPPSMGRRDDQHGVLAIARKQLNEYLGVSAGYWGTINNSNNDLGDKRFDYERHVGSVALEVRF